MSDTNSNCWVQVWDKDYYDDEKNVGQHPNTGAKFYQIFYGPTEVLNLGDVHWPGHPDNNENDDYSSLIVGPEAWFEAFSDVDPLKGESIIFGPGSHIPLLSSIPRTDKQSWENCISRFKLYDHDPSKS